MFYPRRAPELSAEIEELLADAATRIAAGPVPKAIIAPHAGYIYSGPIAASAYARLMPAAERVRRIVLIGPAHRVPFGGLAVPSTDVFATPLGPVRIDKAAIEAIARLPQVHVLDAAHADEHALEVHLPFMQMIFADFSVVPIVVGDASAEDVAGVLEALWGGDETVIVVSSDLSHYLAYDRAQALDARTSQAIESLDVKSIGRDQACGRLPVAGLLTVARRRGLAVNRLDLRNSGDTAGDRARVVGYGAWVFGEPVHA
jgi:AmmeMemoRadiSam system protein B